MAEMRTLARGLQIIDLIADEDRSLRVTDIARCLALDKSSVSRLAKTLVKYGYLQPDALFGGLALGQRLRHIGWRYLGQMSLRSQSRTVLTSLAQETGECAHIAVYDGSPVLIIDEVEVEASLRVVGGIGQALPLHCTAVGKALLAFADLRQPVALEEHTGATITEPAVLRAHLKMVRERGYAVDDEEFEEGVRSLAAPVFDPLGNASAAIGIAGPTVRVTDARVPALALAVQRAASELTQGLRAATQATRGKRRSCVKMSAPSPAQPAHTDTAPRLAGSIDR